MNYDKFIQPKNVEIGGREFAISMVPAVDAIALHNVVAKSVSDNGLIGITMLAPSVDKQLLSYTALLDGGMKIVPDTDLLINDMFKGRVGDAKALVVEMVKYNFGFLINGDLLDRLVPREEATVSGS